MHLFKLVSPIQTPNESIGNYRHSAAEERGMTFLKNVSIAKPTHGESCANKNRNRSKSMNYFFIFFFFYPLRCFRFALDDIISFWLPVSCYLSRSAFPYRDLTV
jgi:hypothetical protein